ncbi:hypothetical protein Nans01_35260 [Nocardiopsis ansamitocini]|uniref:Uncharacterized protein n=1 Tax=Nocardiopsis ansamitocini TaxID=1670832 RepID=A0A9W6UKL5_9ACTN|nr:hypothetical protein Nans01_35260 [Nocardiopsis ansamitocini]
MIPTSGTTSASTFGALVDDWDPVLRPTRGDALPRARPTCEQGTWAERLPALVGIAPRRGTPARSSPAWGDGPGRRSIDNNHAGSSSHQRGGLTWTARGH